MITPLLMLKNMTENCKSVESLRQTLASMEEKLLQREEATAAAKKETEIARQEAKESQTALTSTISKLQHLETERDRLHTEVSGWVNK